MPLLKGAQITMEIVYWYKLIAYTFNICKGMKLDIIFSKEK